MATQPLEDVAKAGKDGPLQLFQLYVIKDRKFCKSLIQREDMHQSQHVLVPKWSLSSSLWQPVVGAASQVACCFA